MRIDEIIARKAEIRSLINTEGAEFDVDALTEEVRALDAEALEIEARAAKEAELRTAVSEKVKAEIEENKTVMEEREMENVIEVRNSAVYINAYANYIKTNSDKECRALLSTNGSGTVPVPEMVEARIRTAWDREGIMSRVKKTYLKGNVKVGFELSATGAVIHEEGGEAPAEETLVLGIVNLVPASIKKWITVSDESLDLSGEEFLNYIYDELTYQIAKKAADDMVAKIASAPAVATSTAVGVPEVTATTIAMGTIADAIAHLSDEATNPVIIMNKLTYAAFKAVQYANGYGADPFEGLPVLFNNSLKAFSAASSGNVYALVGDLGVGAQANFPNGAEITIKTDDLSLAEKDLVKFVGREFVALGLVADKAFVKIKK